MVLAPGQMSVAPGWLYPALGQVQVAPGRSQYPEQVGCRTVQKTRKVLQLNYNTIQTH